MEFTPRRVLLFLIFSLLVLMCWGNIVIPMMQQEAENNRKIAQQKAEAKAKADEEAKAKADKEAKEKNKTGDPKQPGPDVVKNPDDNPKPEVVEKPVPAKPAAPKPKAFPKKDVYLGSANPNDGYYYRVTLTTKGAAVSSIELNDSRYRDIHNSELPLSLAEPLESKGEEYRTFATKFPTIAEKHNIKLHSVNWNVVEESPSKIVFEYVIPDAFRVQKIYTLEKADEAANTTEQRDVQSKFYCLNLDLSVENLQQTDAKDFSYTLQGPVGMPIDNDRSDSSTRDIKLGTVSGSKVDSKQLTSKDLAKQEEKNTVEEWDSQFRYVGVDGQFFTAMLYHAAPETDADGNPKSSVSTDEFIKQYKPETLKTNEANPKRNQLSILFTSRETDLEPGKENKLSHKYTLYAGPKRKALLQEMDAGDVLGFGWFGFISKGMLWILSFLHHSLLLPYGLAIIGLTILVRISLFPLSKKQAQSAARMKELQPQLQEIKKKYGHDKQKLAEAHMQLIQKAGYNPLAGCLPMLLQFPIFIGLYQGLGHAIDLRAAGFLWVDNLAAPDALFPLPFTVWWVGDYFNLLPLLTVGLFLLQSKMFMPKPDPGDEQAQMQQKIMNIMMFVMGFLFYHVPAGLCVYFIASSLWGMGERKLLDYGKAASDQTGDQGDIAPSSSGGDYFKSEPRNGREKGQNIGSKKRGKKTKSRR